MSEWKSIETAPRDGRLFLGYNLIHGEMTVIGYTDDMPNNEEPAWTDVGGSNRAISLEFNLNYFQFWMPLPEPPK